MGYWHFSQRWIWGSNTFSPISFTWTQGPKDLTFNSVWEKSNVNVSVKSGKCIMFLYNSHVRSKFEADKLLPRNTTCRFCCDLEIRSRSQIALSAGTAPQVLSLCKVWHWWYQQCPRNCHAVFGPWPEDGPLSQPASQPASQWDTDHCRLAFVHATCTSWTLILISPSGLS